MLLIKNLLPIVLLFALSGVAVAIWSLHRLADHSSGEAKLRQLGRHILEALHIYLRRQDGYLFVFALFVFAALAIGNPINGWSLAVAYLAGVWLSALAGYVGLTAAARANVRTVTAAAKGLPAALAVAIRGSAVTGLLSLSLALGGLAGIYFYLTQAMDSQILEATNALLGFGFGAATTALFARVGGGIFAKGVDIGEDLATRRSHLSAKVLENPATIADHAGDCIGDVSGTQADLFASFTLATIAVMLIAAGQLGGDHVRPFTEGHVLLPLAAGAWSLVASFVGVWVAHSTTGARNPLRAFSYGLLKVSVLSALGFYALNSVLTGDPVIFQASLIGYSLALILAASAEYFTGEKFAPVRGVVAAAHSGAGITVLTGLGLGFAAAVWFGGWLVVGVLAAFAYAGSYGVAIAAFAVLSSAGFMLTANAFGPIADNAAGLAELTHAKPETQKILHQLDTTGNIANAITKNYAVAAATLATLALFAVLRSTLFAHGASAAVLDFSLSDPATLAGLLLGGLLACLFVAYLLRAVLAAADQTALAVHAQLAKKHLDYKSCVVTAAHTSLRQVFGLALLAVGVPVATAYGIGAGALAGLFVGVVLTGSLLAFLLSTAGAAWDNTKKALLLTKAKDTAQVAAGIGDIVGDGCKDAAAPALNSLIQIVVMTALVAAIFFAS